MILHYKLYYISYYPLTHYTRRHKTAVCTGQHLLSGGLFDLIVKSRRSDHTLYVLSAVLYWTLSCTQYNVYCLSYYNAKSKYYLVWIEVIYVGALESELRGPREDTHTHPYADREFRKTV